MIIYSPLVFAIKLSILFIIIRIFVPYRKIIIFIYTLLSILLCYTIAVTIAKICICMPIDTFWLGTNVTHGHCLKQLDIFLTDTIISIISDLTILILPLIIIWRLKMSKRKKLRVLTVLAAGGLACVTTVVRLVWVIQYQNSTDRTYVIKRIDILA